MLKKYVRKVCSTHIELEVRGQIAELEMRMRDEAAAIIEQRLSKIEAAENRLVIQMEDLAKLQELLQKQAETLTAWQGKIEARYNEDIEVQLSESRNFNEKILLLLAAKTPLRAAKKTK